MHPAFNKLLDGTKGDTKIASELVRDAIKSAEQINTKGLCLKGVADALDMAGLGNIHSPSAYMAGDKLAKNPHFQEGLIVQMNQGTKVVGLNLTENVISESRLFLSQTFPDSHR